MMTKTTTTIRTALISLLLGGGAGLLAIAGDKTPPPADDASALLERANHLENSQGRLAEAEALYRAILADAATHPDLLNRARFQLAGCLIKRREDGPALDEMLDKIPKQRPPNASVKRKRTAGFDWDNAIDYVASASLKQVDKEVLSAAMLKGLAGALGGKAQYFTKADLEGFQVQMNQRLVGIGAILDFADAGDALLIKTVLSGTPAEAAKLQHGDKILSIDGTPIDKGDGDINAAVSTIRGEEGTEVRLAIEERDSGKRRIVTLVRAPIKLTETNTIDAAFKTEAGEQMYMLDPVVGIGAVRLHQFVIGASDLLRGQVTELHEAGMKALAIDLRGNPGGSLSEAVAAASMFVGKELVATSKYRRSGVKEHRGEDVDPFAPLPMVVLVDGETGSAAELMAACLQDHGRAVVIGERSVGKGTIETVLPLENGGAMRLTVAEYFRPSGKAMRRPEDDEDPEADWGVKPDPGYEVKAVEHDRELTSREQFEKDPAWRMAMDYLVKQLAK